MSDNPYNPEKEASILSDSSGNQLENRLDTASSPGSEATIAEPTSDQAAMRDALGEQSYTPAVEAQARLDSAEQAGAVAKIEGQPRTDNSQAEPAIEVKGFENSGAMSNEEVQTYLKDTLPPEHINGDRITEIQYPNTYNGDDTGVVLGVCNTNPENNVSDIQVFAQNPYGANDRDQMEYTITHEVGHNVYYNLPQENQQQWDQISQNSTAREYVTNYAMTNTREDFSESYAHYVRDPEMLAMRSGSKFTFMRDVVFHGRQYGA